MVWPSLWCVDEFDGCELRDTKQGLPQTNKLMKCQMSPPYGKWWQNNPVNATILLYAEYIMRNARLEKAQNEIKIAGRNINNLRYTDDTTFMAESEEELKNLLMKVKRKVKKLA